MKTLSKFLAAVTCLVALPLLVHAQIGLGIRGGINIAKAELEASNANVDNDYQTGFTGGLFTEIGLSDQFMLQPELNFIQKGYKYNITDGASREIKTTMNYLEIPVLLKWQVGSQHFWGQLMAGPSIAYALDGFTKDNGDKTDINFDHLHRADFGLQFGVGAAFSIDPGKIFLDARYGLGLTNINNASNADDNHWMHRGINLGIGYIHLLNKE